MNPLPDTCAAMGSSPDTLLTQLNVPVQQSFCVLPWLHRFTNLGGEIQLCCLTDGEPESQLRGEDGAPLFVDDTAREDDIANCASLRHTRRQMLTGEWPAACVRCLTSERAGVLSRRQYENDHYQGELPAIIADTMADGFAPVRVRSRDYRFGNLCNLKCRMCHPGASAPLLPEFIEIYGQEVGRASLDATAHADWFREPRFWDDFRAHCHELDHLHFAGGEPLIIPEVAKALDICIEEGCAERIELTFNTNVTKLPTPLLDRWPRFKGVNLALSLDGYGVVNEYIRHPARWATTEKHLRFLDQHHARLNVTSAWVNTTVQVYNLFSLDRLIEHLHERYTFIRPMPALSYLSHPQHFDIRILPRRLKRQATQRLTALMERLTTQGASDGAGQIAGLITHLHSHRPSPLWCAEFRRVTEHFDRLRNQNVLSVVPELAPVMSPSRVLEPVGKLLEHGKNRIARPMFLWLSGVAPTYPNSRA